jgi:hypothetical protein
LSDVGATVIDAATAQAAIDYVEKSRPSILISVRAHLVKPLDPHLLISSVAALCGPGHSSRK